MTTTATKERPIIMSAESVRAILDGRKTQTRRVAKARPKPGFGLVPVATIAAHMDEFGDLCPLGLPGDRLWVREAFYHEGPRSNPIWYRANPPKPLSLGRHWKSPLHMPRWACRLVLEVVEVRVERVQAISHADALAEGCRGHSWVSSSPYIEGPHTDDGELPVEEYQRLWDALNAKRGHPWDSNPWVWVIDFRRLP